MCTFLFWKLKGFPLRGYSESAEDTTRTPSAFGLLGKVIWITALLVCSKSWGRKRCQEFIGTNYIDLGWE
jgi:hypothetical protein